MERLIPQDELVQNVGYIIIKNPSNELGLLSPNSIIKGTFVGRDDNGSLNFKYVIYEGISMPSPLKLKNPNLYWFLTEPTGGKRRKHIRRKSVKRRRTNKNKRTRR